MKRSDLEDLIETTFEKVKKLNATKGKEYAPDEEALGNLYDAAEDFGLDPKVVAGIYLRKNYLAIRSFVRTGAVLTEPIEDRVADLILYLVLLLGLVDDERADEQGIVEHAGENQLAMMPLMPGEEVLDADQVRTLAEIRERFTPAWPEPAVTDGSDVVEVEGYQGDRLPVEADAHRATQAVVDTQALPVVGDGASLREDATVEQVVEFGDPAYNQGLGRAS